MSALIGGLMTLIGIALGSYVTYLVQTRTSDRQQRQATFCRLMGHKACAVQYFKLQHQATIRCKYHNAHRLRTTGEPSANALVEAGRWQREAHRMIHRAAESRKDLLELLASVQLLFRPTKEIEDYVQQVADGLAPIVFPEPGGATNLEEWRGRQDQFLEEHIVTKVNKPINQLLAHLRGELSAESKRTNGPASAHTS